MVGTCVVLIYDDVDATTSAQEVSGKMFQWEARIHNKRETSYVCIVPLMVVMDKGDQHIRPWQGRFTNVSMELTFRARSFFSSLVSSSVSSLMTLARVDPIWVRVSAPFLSRCSTCDSSCPSNMGSNLRMASQ
jgi:hypothetical protein